MTPRNHVRVTRTPNTVVTLFLGDRRAIKNLKISLLVSSSFFCLAQIIRLPPTYISGCEGCECVCECVRVCASNKNNAQPFLNSSTHLKEK